MNKIPTYTVCGFLDSGKTTFINNSIKNFDNIGVLLFENGDEKIDNKYKTKIIPIRQTNNFDTQLLNDIYDFIKTNNFEELWIEVNGMMDINKLKYMLNYEFNNKKISDLLHYEDTIYIIKPNIFIPLINDYSTININQILSCNLAYINSSNKNDIKKAKNYIKSINTTIKIYDENKIPNEILSKKHINDFSKLTITTLIIAFIYLITKFIIPNNLIPIDNITIIFLGIILQAFPFLLLGVMISAFIQIFIPTDFIRQKFPKDTLCGILFATLIGFIFPVCDCATIPIFRSLIKKGVPTSAAISFIVATPIINPIVILSTYNAFNGNMNIVFLRTSIGFIVALLIGFIFSFMNNENIIKKNSNIIFCNTYYTKDDTNFIKYIKQIQGEFFNIAKYLIIGALVSSIFQSILKNFNWLASSYGAIISIIIMMSVAFILSLCSSSDAIIARSFGTYFPLNSIMAFLVFGPIIDIKNIILLSSNFTKKFIIKFTLITFIICFLIMSILSLL